MTTLKLTRTMAGLYSGILNSKRITIEYVVLSGEGYDDKGWYGWIGNENVTEYPRPTKRDAIASVLRNI